MTSFNPTLFIIDDNKAFSEALYWLFNSTCDFPVIVYYDAASFLNAYLPEWNGCLLIDLLMPGMNGLELLQELKVRHINLPVIILSGHGDTATALKVKEAGAHDFITKPFDVNHLIKKVQDILNTDTESK